MGRFLHCSWKRPIAGLLALPMVVVGGCGGPGLTPLPTPTFSEETATSGPSQPDEPPPVKYSLAALKTCQEIQQEIPGLPTFLGSEDLGGSAQYWFSRTCTFSEKGEGGPIVSVRFEFWENNMYPVGYLAGVEQAREKFDSTVSSAEEDGIDVTVGPEADWVNPDDVVAGCELSILDDNALLTTIYEPRFGGRTDPRSEECRGGAREVARKFYAAVQPR